MEQEKFKKPIGKIIVIFLLLSLLSTLIYFCFFFRNDLRQLGYNNRNIYLFYRNGIADRIDSKNTGLLYTLESKEFKSENIDYYLLFNEEFDYTAPINELARQYTLDEVKYLQTVFETEEIIDLTGEEKLDIGTFKQLKEKGYENDSCLLLMASLNDDALASLLSISHLSKPESYLSYLENGYSNDVIVHIYNQLGDEKFNDFCQIRYFSALNSIIDSNVFTINYLPRYLLYLQNTAVSAQQAVKDVNAQKDLTDTKKINYSSYYDIQKNDVTELNDTVLINKQHALSDEIAIDDLVDLDGEYRGNNQPLRKDTADAFIAMANALKEERSLSIVAYTNYQSIEDIDTIYKRLLLESKNKANAVDEIAAKAGYSEHETGMATDIALKNDSCYNLEKTEAYDWLLEHCYEYGFIQRYPDGKQSITGYGFIAYHFRYVGIEAATFMNKYNITLEEYTLLFK